MVRHGGVFLAALLAAPLAAAFPAPLIRARHVVNQTDLKDSYDYIVVGGGTAGLTIADRLSESCKYDVLVIEHGDFYDAANPGSARGTRQYSIRSLPQPGLNNRTTTSSMGFCVGGSSAVNGMAVMRGTKTDYNIWAELGNEGSTWDWEGMLPYFKKAIHFIPPNEVFAKDFNVTYDIDAAWGQDENTHVYASFPGGNDPRIKIHYEALKSVPGVEFPQDGHAGSQGVFWYPVSVDPETRQRSYSRTGHWDGLNRNNYDLLTASRVNQILFEGDVVTGVKFVPRGGGEETTVTAKREVIVSAGSIHTPQILQLSGIGPADHLEAAGITLQVDLPGVGANFQDHPIGPSISFQWGETPPTPEIESNLTAGVGGGQGLVAFLDLPIAAPDEFEDIAARYESLDLADYVAPDTAETVLAGYRAQQEIYAREMRGRGLSFMNYIIGGGAGGSPINLHITSRGTIRLNETDPQGDPVIDYRALSNPTDVDLMAAYLGFLRRFFTTGDLKQYNATEVRPGDDGATRAGLEAYIRAGYNPQGWHPIGTAAKMRRELGGVVDDELRVYGVRGLRVADASIMPTLISGTTQLTAYTIGERAADFIKATWEEDGEDATCPETTQPEDPEEPEPEEGNEDEDEEDGDEEEENEEEEEDEWDEGGEEDEEDGGVDEEVAEGAE